MTNLSTDDVRAALEGSTPGDWTGHNMTHAEGRAMTPEELGEYVCNSVKMGVPEKFLFVSAPNGDGGSLDICHTGNGVRGDHNTALIAMAPDLAAEVLRLRGVVEAIENAVSAPSMIAASDRLDDVEAALLAYRTAQDNAETQGET